MSKNPQFREKNKYFTHIYCALTHLDLLKVQSYSPLAFILDQKKLKEIYCTKKVIFSFLNLFLTQKCRGCNQLMKFSNSFNADYHPLCDSNSINSI